MIDFIPDQHPPSSRRKMIMLCRPFEERRLNKWTCPNVIVQPKLEGERCRTIIRNGYVNPYSSEANPIITIPHIVEELHDRFHRLEIELDGELWAPNMTQGDIHSSEGKSKLQYHVFDIVSASSNLYRLNTLNDLLGGQKYNFVRLVHSSVVPRNLSAIETVLNTCVELGHEGIVIRHLYAPYERKRSLWVMKYKPKKTDFYKIVGWEEECSLDGTPKGRLGALWCIGDSGQKFKVALSATKHDIREVFWPVRDSLPGEYLRVHYQALTARKVPYFGRANLALDLSIVSKEEVQDDNLETNS